MSYILDALGKAEGTRKLENLNELSTGVYQPAAESGTWKAIRRILYILVPLLCFYLGYLARPLIDNVQISYDKPSPEPVAVVADKVEATEPKFVVSDAPVETVLQDMRQNVTLEPTLENTPLLSVISYSENNDERFAMINGVIVSEGDVLSSGEQVLQIDKTSVLLEKDDQSYVLTVN